MVFLLFFSLPQNSFASDIQVFPNATSTYSVDTSNLSFKTTQVCSTTGYYANVGIHYGEYPIINSTIWRTAGLNPCPSTLAIWNTSFPTGFKVIERLRDNSNNALPDGHYWYHYYSQNNNSYYFTFTITGGLITDTNIPTPTNTRIISFTYSTTTQVARIQGYWNATTTPNITERLQFHQFSTMLGIESFNEVIATTTGYFDQSFTYKALPTPYIGTTTTSFIADTTLFAEIYQYNNNYATDPFSGVFDSRYKTLLVATTTTITIETGIQIATSTRALFAYPEYECSITSITGCFKNALIWSFYPTQDSIEQYYNFITLIESKAPIGYFFMARDSIQGLNKDGTPTANVTIPSSIRNYIFSPFDLGISGILWVFFLFGFYKRLKFITI